MGDTDSSLNAMLRRNRHAVRDSVNSPMASSEIAPPLSLNSRHASPEIPELLVAVLSQIAENPAARAPATNGARPRVAQDKVVSSIRFIVFNRSAHVAAIAQKEHEQSYPQTGWGNTTQKKSGSTWATLDALVASED